MKLVSGVSMKLNFSCITSLVFFVCLSFSLTGCALQGAADSSAAAITAKSGAGTSGSTYGGQQPIYASHVYVMAANTSSPLYGGASTSLMKTDATTVLDTTVLGTPTNPAYYTLTNTSGYFYLTTSNYSCIPGQQVYVLSLQGVDNYLPTNVAGTGTNNPMIGLMAVLGQCPSDGTFVGHLSFVYVNEVSTIAAAYALAGFATNSYSIGSPASNATVGLANAFANANQLYDVQGTTPFHEARLTTPGTGTTGTVPQELLDTLANMLAACVNGNNTTFPPNASGCTTLYNNTGSAANTADAAIYIAQHPGNAVTALYNLQAGNIQFADDLGAAPNDFTVGIKFSGTGLSSPVAVAVDASGYPFITSSAGTLSRLTPLGVHSTNSPFALSGANYVAVDPSGYAWVSSTTTGTISQLSALGVALPGTPYLNANFATPAGIASDGVKQTVVADPGGGATLFGLFGNSGDLTEITNSGTSATYTNYYDSFANGSTLFNVIPAVSQVAIDSAGYAWVSGDTINCTLLLFCDGENVQRISLSNFTTGGIAFSQRVGSINCFIFCAIGNQVEGIAIDKSGNGWVALAGATNALDRITSTGTITNFTGGGLNSPFGVAIDGASNIWVANSGNSSVSKFTSAGAAVSPTSTGYSAVSTLNGPTNLDIDQSGNIWVVNPTGNNVTELIGAAVPAVRPLSTAVAAGKLGQQP